jgi:hypothetical protein
MLLQRPEKARSGLVGSSQRHAKKLVVMVGKSSGTSFSLRTKKNFSSE